MKNDIPAIEVSHVSKSFTIYHQHRPPTLHQHLASILSKSRESYEQLKVLDDVSFKVNRGEMLGVIGKNGQGKTTLLRILSQIIKPDMGTVKLSGTTVPFLGLGTGFQQDLTAIENIIMYGLFLGIPKSEIRQKIPEILAYAELEKFADTRLKKFSSGMSARLAFATAIQVDPDILLIDEVLSVGDVAFQKKSFQTFLSFKQKGKTIVFVTHNLNHIKGLCDAALFIHDGKIRKMGHPDDVIDDFNMFIKNTSIR